MKVGDKVVASRIFGEFQSTFEGEVVSFYGKDSIVIKTESGYNWVFKRSDVKKLAGEN